MTDFEVLRMVRTAIMALQRLEQPDRPDWATGSVNGLEVITAHGKVSIQSDGKVLVDTSQQSMLVRESYAIKSIAIVDSGGGRCPNCGARL